MRLTKNKKGFITDFMADFYAFLVFILILMLFSIIFTLALGGCEAPGIRFSVVSEANNDLNEEMMLLNYLRTNVDVDGEQMSIAELIAYSYLDNNYDELEEKTKEIFEKIDRQIYTISKCSVVCVEIEDRMVKEIRTDACETTITGDHCNKIKTTIPIFYTQPMKTAVISLSYNIRTIRSGGRGIP